MKRFIFIAVFLSLTILGCDDGESLYDNEVVVSKSCFGNGVEFDSDSVRCGRKGNVYFGLDEIYDTIQFSPLGFYLFHDSSVRNTLDSIWILESDSAKISTCEKLNIPQNSLSGEFCLHRFNDAAGRDEVSSFFNSEKNGWGHYFIYGKHGAYKAFCNVEVTNCLLHYSCVVQYNGTYSFSKVPNADDAELKDMGVCVY